LTNDSVLSVGRSYNTFDARQLSSRWEVLLLTLDRLSAGLLPARWDVVRLVTDSLHPGGNLFLAPPHRWIVKLLAHEQPFDQMGRPAISKERSSLLLLEVLLRLKLGEAVIAGDSVARWLRFLPKSTKGAGEN
jgi:hypothetical protein